MNQIKILAFDLIGTLLIEKDYLDPKFTEIDRHIDLDDVGFYPWYQQRFHKNIKVVKNDINDAFDQMFTIRDFSVFDLSKNYIFAEASNHLSVINNYLDRQGVLKYFKFIINSSEIGYQKPNPKFFEILIDRVGEKPENILFVDDLPDNCASAKTLGINVFNFNPNHDQFNLRKQVEEELQKFEI